MEITASARCPSCRKDDPGPCAPFRRALAGDLDTEAPAPLAAGDLLGVDLLSVPVRLSGAGQVGADRHRVQLDVGRAALAGPGRCGSRLHAAHRVPPIGRF
jgi:hypothetical protein